MTAGAEKSARRLRPEKPWFRTEGPGFDSRHLHWLVTDGCSECVRGRLPLAEALRDQFGPILFAPAVQHLKVCGVGSEVDAGCSGIQPGVAI
jgi:hypothetical protein